jgi:hypothetical protein
MQQFGVQCFAFKSQKLAQIFQPDKLGDPDSFDARAGLESFTLSGEFRVRNCSLFGFFRALLLDTLNGGAQPLPNCLFQFHLIALSFHAVYRLACLV